MVTQQLVASTPIWYTEDIHEALNGGGLHSMTDSGHDMVWLTFTNEIFTHWAVSCSLHYRSTESNMLNKHDSVFWFDDLEDGGALKRFNQTSFFTKLSKKWKFYSADLISHNRLSAHWKSMVQNGFPHGVAYDTATAQQQEYKGAEHRAGLKCTWKELHFHSSTQRIVVTSAGGMECS